MNSIGFDTIIALGIANNALRGCCYDDSPLIHFWIAHTTYCKTWRCKYNSDQKALNEPNRLHIPAGEPAVPFGRPQHRHLDQHRFESPNNTSMSWNHRKQYTKASPQPVALFLPGISGTPHLIMHGRNDASFLETRLYRPLSCCRVAGLHPASAQANTMSWREVRA